MSKQIYNLSSPEVLSRFETSVKGLSSFEAQKRLQKYGFNSVKKKQNWSWFTLVVNQFNDALVWILLVAGSLALVFGETRDTVIIASIVGINALIGFLQEYKAEKTLENIRNLTSERAVVEREGQKIEIDAQFLVPGDIIHLSAGDTVPADAYLLEGFDVYTNEFIFTGESKPGKKIVGTLGDESLPISEINNMFFMGSSVTRGQALAVVTGTSMQTQLGNIAHLVSAVINEETPLQKQMRVLSRDVSILAVVIGAIVMLVGHFYHVSLYDNFLFALALAVSVVPEGLPAAISVSLSLGMKKLLKKNVLAKKLNAVETLASVNIICTDKTGTITRNELMVTNIVLGDSELTVDGNGYEPKGSFRQFGRIIDSQKFSDLDVLMKIAVICNDADLVQKNGMHQITGDPTEGALLVVAQKHQNYADVLKGEKKLTEIPFSSEKMRMSVVCENIASGEIISYVKGSPDVILQRCTHKLLDGKIIVFSEIEKQKAKNSYNALSRQALRVLAFAQKSLEKADKETLLAEADDGLIWVGMMGMIDPPRPDVHKAINECRQSGIKVIMITGDYELTAAAIARNVGLLRSTNAEVINGKTLSSLSDGELLAKIKNKEVAFARITPEQKLKIATVLKQSGAVIAMTGDGVNDAPALKKADIGVAMGIIGTDVAKEAADMILLDDNFASIVRVIKQARTIFENLKKFVYYVFTSNVSEFFTVAIGLLLQIPAPITAVQILAIDLGTDIFPSFSLSLESSEPNIMKHKPFSVNEKVVNRAGVMRLLRVGFVMAVGAIAAFVWSMKRGGWEFGNKIDPTSVLYLRSTTATYAVLSMTQMANLLQARSEKISILTLGFFKNKFALAAIAISVGILLAFMHVEFLRESLHMVPIMWQDWMMVAAATIAVFAFEELRKAFSRQRD